MAVVCILLTSIVLQQMTSDILTKDIHFFDIQPKPVSNVSEAAFWGNNRLMGDSHLFTPNEPNGLQFDYWLNEELKEGPLFYIYNDNGQPIDTINGTNNLGINSTRWNTWNEPPGTYKVLMKAGKVELEKYAELKPKIVYPVLNWTSNKDEN